MPVHYMQFATVIRYCGMTFKFANTANLAIEKEIKQFVQNEYTY